MIPDSFPADPPKVNPAGRMGPQTTDYNGIAKLNSSEMVQISGILQKSILPGFIYLHSEDPTIQQILKISMDISFCDKCDSDSTSWILNAQLSWN